VDIEAELKQTMLKYSELVNAQDADGLAEMSAGSPEDRAEQAKRLRETFSRIEIHIQEYDVRAAHVEGDSGGFVRGVWTYEAKSRTSGKAKTNTRQAFLLKFGRDGRRWRILRPFPFAVEMD
jgi:ketosteroid isomerase-like protein